MINILTNNVWDQVNDSLSVIGEYISNNQFLLSVVVAIIALIISRFFQKMVYNTVIFFSSDKSRSKTNKLLRSYCNLLATILKYIVYAFTFFVILTIYKVPIITMLTSAGFIGVMITYIFQSLIQDVTNGFFIVFESPFGVGDRIKVNDYVGKVVEIKSRYVVLIDAQDNKYIINNRSIDSVVILSKKIEFVR
ncbi:mechanosensitive ion channel family protein [Mycoplasma sp. P36-A1]|uniref:mechanosensitive ion channel family protein n=1 Tax=Mycoplasma sp. P36-A1 TaxID=3252900 RepID=UPI003C2D1AC1